MTKAADHERERFAHCSEIGSDVERVGDHQQAHERDDQPTWGKVLDVGDNAFSRHATNLAADKLDGDHERRGQKHRPQQAIAKLRTGLGICRDAGGVVVGRSRDQSRSEPTQ